MYELEVTFLNEKIDFILPIKQKACNEKILLQRLDNYAYNNQKKIKAIGSVIFEIFCTSI